MNRAQLIRDVGVDLNRQDKAPLIPGWIASAEFRLNNLLRDREMMTRVIIAIDGNTFPTPADYLEADSMSLIYEDGRRGGALHYAPASDVDGDDGKRFVTPGPHWFTVRGKDFEFAGWTNAGDARQVQLYYYAKLKPLVADTDTNWLLEQAPHVYRNAILHFGFLHLEEEERANQYLQMVAAETAAMNDRTTTMKTGPGPLIRRPSKKLGGRFS